ncbi:MAG: hypothetical protein ACREJB_01850 [Planctomycetaceae bacterium]
MLEERLIERQRWAETEREARPADEPPPDDLHHADGLTAEEIALLEASPPNSRSIPRRFTAPDDLLPMSAADADADAAEQNAWIETFQDLPPDALRDALELKRQIDNPAATQEPLENVRKETALGGNSPVQAAEPEKPAETIGPRVELSVSYRQFVFRAVLDLSSGASAARPSPSEPEGGRHEQSKSAEASAVGDGGLRSGGTADSGDGDKGR